MLPIVPAIICRVCENNSLLINLATDSKKPIVKKLRACADIQFELVDELPKHLCQICLKHLDSAYKFKIQCEYTDQKFRDVLQQMANSLTFAIETDPIKIETPFIVNDSLISQAQSTTEKTPSGVEHNKSPVENEVIVDDYSSIDHLIEECDDGELESSIIIEESHCDNLSDISPMFVNSLGPNDEIVNVGEQNDEISYVEVEYNLQTDNDRSESYLNNVEKINIVEDHLNDNYLVENEANSEQAYEHQVELENEEIDYEEEAKNEEMISEYDDDDTDTIEYNHAESEDEQLDESENEKLDASEDEKVVSSTSVPSAPTKSRSKRKPNDSRSPPKANRFKCDTCGEPFENFTKFNEHKKTHGGKRYQCGTCGKWFSKRYHMKNHAQIHLGEKNFECPTCLKKYTNQGNLDRHIRVVHYKEKSYFCGICKKGFSQSATLKQHFAIHVNERNFECDVCHKRYKTADYLSLHKSRHLPREQPPIRPHTIRPSSKKRKPPLKISICTFCGKKSNSITLHQSHMRTHTGEQPYECEYCKKKFSFQQSLKSHLLLHTGEKPYCCDICGVSFRQIGHLNGHKLVHSGIKQHKCDFCPKTFSLRGNLNVHRRIHTGDTPYHCTVCPKKFYDSNGLKRHSQTHKRKGTLVFFERSNEASECGDEILGYDSELLSNSVNKIFESDDMIVEDHQTEPMPMAMRSKKLR